MAKKKKLNPIQAYIDMEVEWARICRETVYGKKIEFEGRVLQLFNFNLDDREDCYGSGTYRAYKLLAMAEKADRIVQLLGMAEVQDALDAAAKEHGYGIGQQLLMKSMNWDEKAWAIRDAIFKEYS